MLNRLNVLHAVIQSQIKFKRWITLAYTDLIQYDDKNLRRQLTLNVIGSHV